MKNYNEDKQPRKRMRMAQLGKFHRRRRNQAQGRLVQLAQTTKPKLTIPPLED